MKTKTIKSLAGIVAGATALVGLVGCAGTNVPYQEPVQSKREIYSSPVIKSEYEFEVVSRSGNVDISKPIFEKDEKLYVVGFSTASTDTGMAKMESQMDAASRAVKRIYGSKITKKGDETRETVEGSLAEFSCRQYNYIGVKDKSGRLGTIVETLCDTPLSRYQIPSMPPRKGGDLGLPAPVEYKKPATRETEAQKVKREIREYIQRNKINLSVLEKGEEVTGIYSFGDDDRNKMLVTNKASPIVKEIDKKVNQFSRLRNSDIEGIARLTGYVMDRLDRGCNEKKCIGKSDRMITGKEARASENYLKQYVESKMKNKNRSKRK